MGSTTTSESSKKNGLVEILTRMGWTVTSMLCTLSVVVAVLAAAALCACMRACVRAFRLFVGWFCYYFVHVRSPRLLTAWWQMGQDSVGLYRFDR